MLGAAGGALVAAGTDGVTADLWHAAKNKHAVPAPRVKQRLPFMGVDPLIDYRTTVLGPGKVDTYYAAPTAFAKVAPVRFW